jgi:drug/metabolite transporter (DMT)-like permease
VTEPSSVIGELPAEPLPTPAAPSPERARRALRADAALLLVTAIWGGTFVMVKDAVAEYPVFGFLALRFGIAAAVLLPFVVARRHQSPGGGLRLRIGTRMNEWRGGARAFRHDPPDISGVEPSGGQQAEASIPVGWGTFAPLFLGLALFAGYAFQTFGLALTTPAKAGFITGLGVVMVPVASALLLRQPPSRAVWLGVVMATAGLALLTLDSSLAANAGDLLVLFGAASFAVHILLTGRFAPGHDPLRLLFGQVLTVAVVSLVASLLFETRPGLPSGQVWFAAAFTGLFATAVAFGIQTLAQRFTTASHTALIFAAEPVFAALFSFLLIGEVLGPRQLLGCALILAGMVAAELGPATGERASRGAGEQGSGKAGR